MTRRNQKYFVEVEWKPRRGSMRKTFQENYKVSSMAVASNRALRKWRHSTQLNKERPKNVIIRIERIETPTRERGSGKRKKYHE